MIDRILKNWKTTTIGLLILIICFVLIFVGKATLSEVGGFICGGFYVLFSKDSMLKKKETVSIIIIGSLLLLGSCRPYRSFTNTTEYVQRDTLIIRDSVHFTIEIPGDSVWIKADSIIYDTVFIHDLRTGKFTISPWDTCAGYAYARAGITNNVPWLYLEQRTINVDTMIYVNHIRILEQRIKELEKQIVVKEWEPFYKNTWLWISIILSILYLKRYVRN